MTFNITYGEGRVGVEVPESHPVFVLEPKRTKGIGSLTEELRKADVESLLRKFRRVTLIINDATRPTPTAEVLTGLRPVLAHKEVKILVGTGAHRRSSEGEYQRLLGEGHDELRPTTFAHDWRDERLLDSIGRTTRGTPVVLNKRALEAEVVLAISSVEPHWFAGYTGGRKSLLPAIAGEQSILANHKLVLKGESDSLKLTGNPVHEDMEEALDLFPKPYFGVMTVQDADGKVAAVYAGTLKEAFLAAIPKADEVYTVELPEKADIAIAVAAPPMDSDFFQARKAYDNGFRAVKPGGIVILVAQCGMGLGNPDFIGLLRSSRDPDVIRQKIESEYALGYHTAKHHLDMAEKVDLWAVTDMESGIAEELFVKPCPSLDLALKEAFRWKGRDARVAVLPQASLTVPRVHTG
jgi:nickel-dependent lactate racemase